MPLYFSVHSLSLQYLSILLPLPLLLLLLRFVEDDANIYMHTDMESESIV